MVVVPDLTVVVKPDMAVVKVFVDEVTAVDTPVMDVVNPEPTPVMAVFKVFVEAVMSLPIVEVASVISEAKDVVAVFKEPVNAVDALFKPLVRDELTPPKPLVMEVVIPPMEFAKPLMDAAMSPMALSNSVVYTT